MSACVCPHVFDFRGIVFGALDDLELGTHSKIDDFDWVFILVFYRLFNKNIVWLEVPVSNSLLVHVGDSFEAAQEDVLDPLLIIFKKKTLERRKRAVFHNKAVCFGVLVDVKLDRFNYKWMVYEHLVFESLDCCVDNFRVARTADLDSEPLRVTPVRISETSHFDDGMAALTKLIVLLEMVLLVKNRCVLVGLCLRLLSNSDDISKLFIECTTCFLFSFLTRRK
jgi:hypothetical protein